MPSFDKRKKGLTRGGGVVDMRDALRRATDGGPQIVDVALDELNLDQRLQMRVKGLDEEHVARLLASLEDGGTIDEPVIVFEDKDKVLWLADGFHRVEAHRRANRKTIVAEIRIGAFDEALEYAEEANLKHGLNFSTEDKKQILFSRIDRGYKTNDIEWGKLSNSALASELGVNVDTIRRWFEEYATLANAKVVDRSVVYGRDGRKYDMTGSTEANRRRAEDEKAAKEAEEKQRAAELRERIDRMSTDDLQAYVNDHPDDDYAKGMLAARRVQANDEQKRLAELEAMTDDQLNNIVRTTRSDHKDYRLAVGILQRRMEANRRQRFAEGNTPPPGGPARSQPGAARAASTSPPPSSMATSVQDSTPPPAPLPPWHREKPPLDPSDPKTVEAAILRQGSVEGPALRMVKEIVNLAAQFQANRNLDVCQALPEGQQIRLIDTLTSVVNHSQNLLAQLGAAEMMHLPMETYLLMVQALDASAQLIIAIYHMEIDIDVPFKSEIEVVEGLLLNLGYGNEN